MKPGLRLRLQLAVAGQPVIIEPGIAHLQACRPGAAPTRHSGQGGGEAVPGPPAMEIGTAH